MNTPKSFTLSDMVDTKVGSISAGMLPSSSTSACYYLSHSLQQTLLSSARLKKQLAIICCTGAAAVEQKKKINAPWVMNLNISVKIEKILKIRF
jgi:hypothetical protein